VLAVMKEFYGRLGGRNIKSQFGVGGVEGPGPGGARPPIVDFSRVWAVVGGIQGAEPGGVVAAAQRFPQELLGHNVGVRLVLQQSEQVFLPLEAAEPPRLH
jgi:hypothetical protein